MGEQLGLPRINEVAAFLNAYSPNTKAVLETRGGEVADLVKLGVEGGEATAPVDRAREGMTARAEVLDATLAGAIAKALAAATSIRLRLAALRRIRFVSAVLAAVAASSVLPAAFASTWATIAAGVLALASNLVGLGADKLVLGPNLKETDLSDAVGILTRVAGEAGLTQKLLEALRRYEYDLEDMKQLLNDANRLFGELMNALTKAPGLSETG